jgi:hypothetical protein
MLKTVSSITNAIGALNFVGTWNASTNTPAIVSGVGVKGDYYVVGVAGSTTIDGISNWGIGDWIVYNGSVWQRVEGGADLNGVNISFSGTSSGPTYETSNATTGLTIADNEIEADGTDTNINIVITPKGSGNAVLTTGNLVVADGNGIDFSATPGTGTSELLDDYERGTWTPQYTFATSGTATMVTSSGAYTKVGRMVTVNFVAVTSAVSSPTGAATITGLPFTSAASGEAGGAIGEVRRFATDMPNLKLDINTGSSVINLLKQATDSSTSTAVDGADFSGSANSNRLHGTITYFV